MNNWKKTLTFILTFSMVILLSSSIAVASDETTGGELLKDLYESEQELISEDISNISQIDQSRAITQYSYLTNIIEANDTYANSYGGAYLDGERLLVKL